MTERVVSVAPNATVDALASLLVGSHLGGVPVVDGEDRVIGFISQSDLVAALLKGLDPMTRAVSVMSRPPIVIDEFAPADEVMGVLRGSQIHHLPVVREGKLVGIITPHDVLRYFVDHVLPAPPEVG